MAKLTNKQEMFCREYLVDLNAKQAAIRAGYSEKTAEQQAYQLLQKTLVVERIAELKLDRNERVQIDSDYVLRRLVEIDQMDVIDIFDDDMNLKPLLEWPKVWRQFISGFDLSTMKTYSSKSDDGEDDSMEESILKKIKWPDKVKNLELIGRHTTVGAWKDRVDHTHKIIDDGSNEW